MHIFIQTKPWFFLTLSFVSFLEATGMSIGTVGQYSHDMDAMGN